MRREGPPSGSNRKALRQIPPHNSQHAKLPARAFCVGRSACVGFDAQVREPRDDVCPVSAARYVLLPSGQVALRNVPFNVASPQSQQERVHFSLRRCIEHVEK